MSQRHSDYKIGDIIKGLQLISEPYKINGRYVCLKFRYNKM